MLTQNDKSDLRWAMQAALLEQTHVLHENRETVKDYVLQEATYEQLLNLCFNPYSSNEVYMESEDLEWVAQDVIYEMTGVGQYVLESTSDKFNLLESIIEEKLSDYSQMRQAIQAKGNKKSVGQAERRPKQKDYSDRSRAQLGEDPARVTNSRTKAAPKPRAPRTKAAPIPDGATRTRGSVGMHGPENSPVPMANRGKALTAREKARAALSNAGTKLSTAANTAKTHVGANKKAYGAAAGVAAATAAYYIYRKARKAGKDKREAAAAAQSTAKTPAEKAKWAAKARG